MTKVGQRYALPSSLTTPGDKPRMRENMNKGRHCQSCPSRLNSVFQDLTEEHVARLDESKTTNFYKRGQTLFYEGNQPTGLFLCGGRADQTL